jgi:hypothetical protein
MVLRGRPFCIIWNLRPSGGKKGSRSFRMSTYPLCSSSDVILFEYASFGLNASDSHDKCQIQANFAQKNFLPNTVSFTVRPDSFSTPKGGT